MSIAGYLLNSHQLDLELDVVLFIKRLCVHIHTQLFCGVKDLNEVNDQHRTPEIYLH